MLTFTTKGTGFAFLTSTKLKVKKGRIEVPMKCAKAFDCSGGVLAATTRSKGKKVTCGTATFGVKAGKKKTIKTSKVSAKCRTLLLSAPSTKIKAHLSATFTYQKPISKDVTVTFVS